MNDSAPNSSGVFVVIAGGGTAGHVSPGLAIAGAVEDRGHERGSIRWIGSSRGLEADLVPEVGYAIDLLPGRGIARSVKPAAIVANVKSIAGLLVAFGRAFGLLRRYRPQVVLVLGGYASAPCVAAAALLRLPIVVTEQNARAGLSNRVAARFARACAVPFPDTDLPRSVVTGNPVRAEILAVSRLTHRASARAELEVPDGHLLIGVFSGSLGSKRINDAVFALQARWRDRPNITIRHVSGRRDYPSLSERLVADSAGAPNGTALHYDLVAYEERMHLLLAAADVVVSRSGGNTVAEIAQVGVASLLVPLPIATRDHQTANADALVRVGAAVRIADDEFNVDRLEEELDRMIEQPESIERMADAARSLARPDAADRVAALLEENARE